MAFTVNKYQKEIGSLLGLKSVNSQNDLDQISKFSKAYGVNNVNSSRDVQQLTPQVAGWLSKSQAPAGGALPTAAAQGDAGPAAMQDLLMQQSSAVTQQETYFDQLLKQQQLEQQQQGEQLATIQKQYQDQQAAQQLEFAKQQETWNQELLKQQQAQAAAKTNTTNAATPGAVAGWTPNASGIQTLEQLLMGSTAKTNAMTSFSTVIA